MTSFSEDFLSNVHEHSFKNREELARSVECTCFHCFEVFSPEEIELYYTEKDRKQTALCPFCLVDAVIGDAAGFDLSDRLIDAMAYYYFRGLTREDMKDFNGPEIVILE